MTAPAQDAPLPSGVRGFLRRSAATPLDIGLTIVVALIVAAAARPVVRWALIDDLGLADRRGVSSPVTLSGTLNDIRPQVDLRKAGMCA